MNLLTLDFETYYDPDYSLKKLRYSEYILGREFKVHGVGIAINDDHAVWHTAGSVSDVLAAIEWSNTALVGQNLMFDASILAWRYGYHPAFMYDTRLISTYLWHNESASLEDICKRLWPTNPTRRKGNELSQSMGIKDLSSVDGLEESIAGYCATNYSSDVNLTRAAFNLMSPKVIDDELKLMDHTLRLFTRPLLQLNTEPLEEILSAETQNVQKTLTLAEATREQLASNPKFAELLVQKGATVPIKINAKGKIIPAFAKSDLGFQRLMVSPSPAIRALVTARMAVKSRITETRATVLLDEGRLHRGKLPVPLKYSGAVTRRWSSQQKINFNNMPKKGRMREAIVAPPGMSLVTGDCSQIEARLVAMLSKQPDLLHVFATGGDPYKAFGETLYNKPAEEVEGDERFICKGAMLGLQFGMAAFRFALSVQSQAKLYLDKDIIIPKDEAERTVATYRRKYSEIPKMWNVLDGFLGVLRSKNIQHKASWYMMEIRPGRIILPNGMDVQYSEKTLEKLWGGWMTETIAQSLSRILLAHYILEAEKEYRVTHHCYDELTLLVPDNEIDDAIPWLEKLMSTPLDWCADLPLAAEVVHGKYYSK